MWRTVGVAAEKAESWGCMLLTGAGEIVGVECAIGVSGLEQVFFFFYGANQRLACGFHICSPKREVVSPRQEVAFDARRCHV